MENNDSSSELAPAVARERETEQAPAWAMIEPGRYQPKRIRGSCLGRELGWTFFVPPSSGDQSFKPPVHDL